MYALVISNTIKVGPLPGSARRLDTDQWLSPPGGLANGTDAERAACGYFPVTDTPRPADDQTTTYDRSVTLVNSVPTVTWTARPKTAQEQANDTANANRATIQQQAQTALANNRTYLAIATPTAAQVRTQTDALTRQMNGVIRLLLNQLDGVN